MLRILLVAHAAITAAAGVVLVVAPGAIPGAVGIDLGPGSFLLCYFLAAAELSFAALSLLAARASSPRAIGISVQTIIIFHVATGLLEAYSATRGVSLAILWNVALRALVVTAFAWFGRTYIGSREDRV